MPTEHEINAAIAAFRKPSEHHTTLEESMKASLKAAAKVREDERRKAIERERDYRKSFDKWLTQ